KLTSLSKCGEHLLRSSQRRELPRRLREPDELTCHSRHEGSPVFGPSSLAANLGDSVAIQFEFAISINSRSLLRVSSTLESCSFTRKSERMVRARAKSLVRNMGASPPKVSKFSNTAIQGRRDPVTVAPGHDA